MASRPASMDVQDVRALAHRLYCQCRDSPGAFRNLTASVRKLRNVLEEVEEVLDGRQALKPEEIRVLDRIADSKTVLTQLDNALQHSRYPPHAQDSPNEGAVADFQTYLDVTEYRLSVAFITMRCADDMVPLDASAHLPALSPRLQSAYTSASSEGLGRELSVTSSAWSSVNRESRSATPDTALLPGDSDLGYPTAEEKEVYVGEASAWMPAGKMENSHVSPNWLSPFASLDPLSIDIEQASTMILGSATPTSSDGLPLKASETKSSSALDSDARAEQDPLELEAEVAVELQELDHADAQVQRSLETLQPLIYDGHGDVTKDLSNCEVTKEVNSQDSRSMAPQPDDTPTSAERSETVPDVQSSTTHLCQQGSSRITDEPVLPDAPAPSNVEERDLREPSRENEDDLAGSLTDILEDYGVSTTRSQTPPPPPPPKPRRSRTRAASVQARSRYRIVNQSPHSRSSSCSSDDLYTTSRPQSAGASSLGPRSKSLEAPFVIIDSTALTTALPSELPSEPAWSRSSTASLAGGSDEQREGEMIAGLGLRIRAEDIQTVGTEQVSSEDTAPALPTRPTYHHDEKLPVEAFGSAPPGVRPSSDSAVNHANAGTEPRLDVRHHTTRVRKSMDNVLRENWSHLSQSMRDRPWSHSSLLGRSKAVPGTNAAETPPRSHPAAAVREYYGPSGPDSRRPVAAPEIDVDEEHIGQIVDLWNNRAWEQAEDHLRGLLEMLSQKNGPDDTLAARRIRHLMGVCASFKGDFHRAVALFMSVLRMPLRDVADLDVGDCAAAYWLGDTYAILNRRPEALLAYSIAEWSPLFQNPEQPNLPQCIRAEQECCKFSLSREDTKTLWAQEDRAPPNSKGSLLDRAIIPHAVAVTLLDGPRKTNQRLQEPLVLKSTENRATVLYNLDARSPKSPQVDYNNKLKIAADFCLPGAPWPLAYDPFFTMANVSRGRLLVRECDLLKVFGTDAAAKIPAKSRPVGLIGLVDRFTSNDLVWLIRTIRDCLRSLEIKFAETANLHGAWFTARYVNVQQRIATGRYFSIAIFSQSFRSGYGVEICSDGMCSARLIDATLVAERGVHSSEPRRIKRLIREYLADAKHQAQKKQQNPATNPEKSTVDVAGETADRPMSAPPPPPPPKPTMSPRASQK